MLRIPFLGAAGGEERSGAHKWALGGKIESFLHHLPVKRRRLLRVSHLGLLNCSVLRVGESRDASWKLEQIFHLPLFRGHGLFFRLLHWMNRFGRSGTLFDRGNTPSSLQTSAFSSIFPFHSLYNRKKEMLKKIILDNAARSFRSF